MRAGLLPGMIRVGHQRYRNWTFEFQATLVAAVILICGMAAMGGLVGNRLEEGFMQSAASETVLNMDNFIKPLVQDIARQTTLPKAAQEALSAVLLGKTLGRNVAAIKIWSPSGTIVYSNRPEIVGRTYPMFRNLQQAFDGRVIAEFDDLADDENEFERSLGTALLEIYAPLRETSTNRIIAVAARQSSVPVDRGFDAALARLGRPAEPSKVMDRVSGAGLSGAVIPCASPRGECGEQAEEATAGSP